MDDWSVFLMGELITRNISLLMCYGLCSADTFTSNIILIKAGSFQGLAILAYQAKLHPGYNQYQNKLKFNNKTDRWSYPTLIIH
jgi:hypothetical protein